jgi:hypothetical protein
MKGLLAVTCVPLQYCLSIKPLLFPSCDKEHHFITTLQGTAYSYIPSSLCHKDHSEGLIHVNEIKCNHDSYKDFVLKNHTLIHLSYVL